MNKSDKITAAKYSALVLHLIEVIQNFHNNNLSWNVKRNVAYTSSPTPIGGGGEVGGGGGWCLERMMKG